MSARRRWAVVAAGAVTAVVALVVAATRGDDGERSGAVLRWNCRRSMAAP